MSFRAIWRSCLTVVILNTGFVSQASAVLPVFDPEGQVLPSLAPLRKNVNPAVVKISTFTTK